MTRQNYTCPKCDVRYGEVKSVSELDPIESCGEPCLKCGFGTRVYEFIPEARE